MSASIFVEITKKNLALGLLDEALAITP